VPGRQYHVADTVVLREVFSATGLGVARGVGLGVARGFGRGVGDALGVGVGLWDAISSTSHFPAACMSQSPGATVGVGLVGGAVAVTGLYIVG